MGFFCLDKNLKKHNAKEVGFLIGLHQAVGINAFIHELVHEQAVAAAQAEFERAGTALASARKVTSAPTTLMHSRRRPAHYVSVPTIGGVFLLGSNCGAATGEAAARSRP